MNGDEFEPQIGKIRARGSRGESRFLKAIVGAKVIGGTLPRGLGMDLREAGSDEDRPLPRDLPRRELICGAPS